MLKNISYKSLFNFIFGFVAFFISIKFFYKNEYLINFIESPIFNNFFFYIGILFFITHIFLNYKRWNVLLKYDQTNSEKKFKNFTPFFGTLFINFIIPIKIGDIYRIITTKDICKKKLLQIIIIERSIDVAVLFLILILGILLFLYRLNINYFILALVTIFVLTLFGYGIMKIFKTSYFIDNLFYKTKKFFPKIKIKFNKILFLTIISWISELIFFFILFKIIFKDFSIEEIFITHSSSILSFILPSGPAFIGPVDFTINGILNYYNHEKELIINFIFIFHFVIMITSFLIFMILIIFSFLKFYNNET